ncbi:MAG: hypothetical protein II850_08535 [Fibrobacter sp.]|nr:hypothetical protein [Fibrobacter sp.]
MKTEKQTTSSIGQKKQKNFYKALKAMLKSYDALEEDSAPIEEHPHIAFRRFLINRTRYWYDIKKLKPIHFLRIPFEIANGHDEGIDAETRKKYNEYLDELLKHYRASKKWNIASHIESLRQLNESSRVFDFESERKKKGWGGWYPNEWRKKSPDSWKSNIDDYQNIANEFRLAHSLAVFASKCESHTDSAKDKYPLYYLGIIEAKNIYCKEPDNNLELADLHKTLQALYSEQIPFEFFEKNLAFFSPYYLRPQEMDTFFKWAICHCVHNNKKPNLPFLKKLWALGKLFKVHCFHFDFLDTARSKINDRLYVKIKELEKHLVNGVIEFPPNDYGIEDDLSKAIRFLGREFPIDFIVSLTQNLFHFDNEYSDARKVGNPKLLEKNKELIDKRKTSLSILDWLEFPLTKDTDKPHRFVGYLLKAICIYNRDPELYNAKMLEMGPTLLEEMYSIKLSIDKGEAVGFPIFSNDSVDESIVMELCVILGLIERFLYPCKIVSEYDDAKKKRILSILKYITEPDSMQVVASRFPSIFGSIVMHNKILRLVTCQDIINSMRGLRPIEKFSEKFTPLVMSETMRLISKNKRDIELMSTKNLDAIQSAVYEECKKKVEQNEKDFVFNQEICSLNEHFVQQIGKTPPESNNS